GFHVQSEAQHEGNVLRLAQIGQPVPAEEALAGDHQAIAERGNGFEKSSRLRGHFLVQDDSAGVVENAQVHCPGVQIDSAIKCVRLLVKTHHGLLWHGSGSLSPHRGWKATPLPENPTLGQNLRGFEPVYPWDRPRPIPSETMISIKTLQQTAAAMLFSASSLSLSAAAAAELFRSAAEGHRMLRFFLLGIVGCTLFLLG